MKKEVKVALCGGVRVGKSTVADHLEAAYHMVQFAFGDELKKGFHYQYPGVPRSPKPVGGYQLYGQLQRYVFGDDYWVNLCFDNIRHIASVARNYNITGEAVGFRPLVTDLRQPNELERLRDEGYTIIRVEAPYHARLDRMFKEGDRVDEENLTFETETFVSDFEVDYVITNDGSLEELYLQVDKIMSVLLEGEE